MIAAAAIAAADLHPLRRGGFQTRPPLLLRLDLLKDQR